MILSVLMIFMDESIINRSRPMTNDQGPMLVICWSSFDSAQDRELVERLDVGRWSR